MRIIIETIPHREQRYPTTGDWGAGTVDGHDNGAWTYYDADGDDLIIRVSRMGDWRYEALVGIHEAVEAVLCKHAGISEESVNAFDIAYENARHPADDSEPGDQGGAPYYRQHQIATGIERILAAELGVDWNAYEAANLALYAEDSSRG